MSKVGKNTPHSVLAFIEVHLSRIPDPLELARELDYDEDAIEHLQAKHGERLLPYLQGVWRRRQDTDRYMARQAGRRHPQQHVSSRLGAIDDLPEIPRHYEDRVNDLSYQGAEKLYAEMCNAKDAVRKLLDSSTDPLYQGELRRSHAQMERACEKARQRLAAYELDRAA